MHCPSVVSRHAAQFDGVHHGLALPLRGWEGDFGLFQSQLRSELTVRVIHRPKFQPKFTNAPVVAAVVSTVAAMVVAPTMAASVVVVASTSTVASVVVAAAGRRQCGSSQLEALGIALVGGRYGRHARTALAA
jgi:hypothetical protein